MKRIRLKKVILLALTICTILVIYGCGGAKEVTMDLGEKTTVGEYVEFTPVNVLVTDQVYPPITNSYSMGWTADKGKNYVVVIAKVKNPGEKAIKVSDLCAFRLSSGEDTSDSNMIYIVTEDGRKLSGSGSIGAGDTQTLYFITEMDEEVLKGEIYAEFAFLKEDDEPVYSHKLSIDGTKPVAVTEKLEVSKKITADGFCELTPTSIKFAKKIEPSNPGYYYNYYKANGKDEKLLVLSIKTKNLSKSERDAYGFYGITVIYDDVVYIGGVVADDENKANITEYEKIPAGDSRATYGVLSLPTKAENGKCDLYLYVDGTYYQYTYEK